MDELGEQLLKLELGANPTFIYKGKLISFQDLKDLARKKQISREEFGEFLIQIRDERDEIDELMRKIHNTEIRNKLKSMYDKKEEERLQLTEAYSPTIKGGGRRRTRHRRRSVHKKRTVRRRKHATRKRHRRRVRTRRRRRRR